MKGHGILAASIDFANFLLAALVVGAMFGVWLSFNPAGLDAPLYVALQQQEIRALNVVMPVLGTLTIVLTLASAALARDHLTRFALLLAAAGCFTAAGLVTRLLNQPINAVVLTWEIGAPPSDWMQFRDTWWHWHEMRLILGVVGLGILIVATLVQVRWRTEDDRAAGLR
jgi:anthrone oxygenase-like protein